MNGKFFYFPPWKKQFYFSEELLSSNTMFNPIYSPYSFNSRIVWYLWRNFSFFRKLFRCSSEKLPGLYFDIIKIAGLDDSHQCQINTGTPGDEQKMTMYVYINNVPIYFIKAGTTDTSIRLINNEASVLNSLPSTFKTPKVKKCICHDNFSLLFTEPLNARKLNVIGCNEEILLYIYKINVYKVNMVNDMLFCFSHGDCCPWNILERTEYKDIVLIDWELAGMYPLGYDLITYIFRTHFLLYPSLSPKSILDSHYEMIKKYYALFDIYDIKSYMSLIAHVQIDYVKSKGLLSLTNSWKMLSDIEL